MPPNPIDSEAAGLSTAQAAQRLREEGPNSLPAAQRRGLLRLALATLREPMFLLLLAAAALYLLFGSLQEGLTLAGFVLITLALTLYQEGKSERAIDALRELSSPRARVIRDGRLQQIDGAQVVRGDLLQLGEGERIAADGLLLRASGARADESLLTGEAVPVAKRAARAGELTPGAALPPPGGDDLPSVYGGTLLVQGQALARVTATGARSQVGQIGAALATVQEADSPLQQQTARLVRNLALLALVLSATLVLLVGLLKGDWLQALLAGIALAMAMLPEEYPVVLTVFPALGAHRLARLGVLTRRINAIETLGATTVLCCDKTGTLTENRMTVTHLVAGSADAEPALAMQSLGDGSLPETFRSLVEVAMLASPVRAFDPMEQAIHQLGARLPAGSAAPQGDASPLHSLGPSPALRALVQVWPGGQPGVQTVAAKGAPETVMDLCRMGAAERSRLAERVDVLAAQGLRVLGVARAAFNGRDWPADASGYRFEFIGLLGLADPLRPTVRAAVAECQGAGIRVLMVTGDYPLTARAIGVQAGLVKGEVAGDLLSGDEVATLGDEALRERLASVRICARIAPAQKLRIVQALKARGEVVAMTGDGVNDAPALRAAHVGVAMGQRGTDVAREAAALVLVHDDFAALVAALRMGRRIYDNLRKAMSYVLAVHVPIAGMALLPLLLGWPALLYPMHIALLELIIDPACSLAFENEPAESDLMQRPPRDAAAPLFGRAALALALLQGLVVLAAVLGGFAWAAARLGEPQARAFAFATLVTGNLGLILSHRSARHSLWALLRTPNRTLWWILAGAVLLLLGGLYLPWAAGVLRFAPLPLPELAAAGALGALSVLCLEALKWVGRGGRSRERSGGRAG